MLVARDRIRELVTRVLAVPGVSGVVLEYLDEVLKEESISQAALADYLSRNREALNRAKNSGSASAAIIRDALEALHMWPTDELLVFTWHAAEIRNLSGKTFTAMSQLLEKVLQDLRGIQDQVADRLK